MPIVSIYTDGACSPNPGPGGWGAILFWNNQVKEISGSEAQTTNNRMELTAAVKALQLLKRKSVVILYTDSTYLRNGITQWIVQWKHKGWKLRNNQPVKNVDLWQELDRLNSFHEVTWEWVKAHSSNKWNNRADTLARNAISGETS